MKIKLEWKLELLPKVLSLGCLIAILSVAVSEVHSFDVFWQLQSGKYIWQTKSIIHTDLFTLAYDAPRVEHTWVHSLILFAIYSMVGYSGISVLKGVLIAGAYLALLIGARIRSSSWLAILLVTPVFLKTSHGWLERPQIWTFLMFALFVLILERFQNKQDWHILWLVPLTALWANLHAGSVLAAAIFAAYVVGAAGKAIWKKDFKTSGFKQLGVAVALSFLAANITPYPNHFVKVLLAVSKLGGSTSPMTGEAGTSASAPITQALNMDWTVTTFQAQPEFYYAMGISALILLLGWKRFRLSDLCLMVGLALMGMKLIRHIPFFYMGMIAILPAYLDSASKLVQNRFPKLAQQAFVIITCCLAIWLFWHWGRPLYLTYGTFTTGLREWHYPIEATEFVKEHKLPANIYNTYDWGGYMAWQLYPDYLMFWDGRQNSKEMFKLGWQVMAGHQGWDSILERFDVKTIVSRSATIDTGQKYPLLDQLRNNPDWSLVFNDESSMVFVLNNSVAPDWLKRYARPKSQIDNTVMSEAHLMTSVNANRYMSWWSMTEIYMKRKQYNHAWFAIQQYMKRAPRPSPQAVRIYRQLETAYQDVKE